MAQGIKALAAKPELGPQSHVVEGKNWLLRWAL